MVSMGLPIIPSTDYGWCLINLLIALYQSGKREGVIITVIWKGKLSCLFVNRSRRSLGRAVLLPEQ